MTHIKKGAGWRQRKRHNGTGVENLGIRYPGKSSIYTKLRTQRRGNKKERGEKRLKRFNERRQKKKKRTGASEKKVINCKKTRL